MTFSLTEILVLVACYLSLLFAIAHLAERQIIPRAVTHHPLTYVLSLGVFAGVMSSNVVIEVAYRYGYNFLLYYCGAGLVFLLGTLILVPILRLSRVYQLASLADMLVFRFRSSRVGAAITITMSLAMLPLLALQIQVVSDSVHYLTGFSAGEAHSDFPQTSVALMVCIVITLFAILFGTGHASSRRRNTGLVTAMAFESLVKLLALLGVMFAVIYQLFSGPDDLAQWLREYPPARQQLTTQLSFENAHTLLLVFFAGAVCMPHIFHMMFAENTESKHLYTASWGVPLYLMCLSLPVLPLAWGGMMLEHPIPMAYSGIAIGQHLNLPNVSIMAFIATLSAATATIVVTTLALANMCLNHLILPYGLLKLAEEADIYRPLRHIRRAFIVVLILAGYGFYLGLDDSQNLTALALVAFSGTLQFLPGIIATPHWPRANRRGLLAGLAGGLGVWLALIMMPAILGDPQILDALFPSMAADRVSMWAMVTILSLGFNVALFAAVSLLTEPTADERIAAEICAMDELARPTRQILPLASAAGFSEQLAPVLGEKAAADEVQRALAELHFGEDENRPYALRRLRRRIEANLSGLLGPSLAHTIIEQAIPFVDSGTEDINLIERNLDSGQVQFTGLAADLDKLRRRYRETLDQLPIGVCSIGTDGEMLMWNAAMEDLTEVTADDVQGSLLTTLPDPWQALLADFQRSEDDTVLSAEITTDPTDPRWVSLHKTSAADGDTVILVEDITAYERLEAELLHSERLASIGRLAAGVAHEIGNPVTGIACLAQNLEYADDPEEIALTAQDILKQTNRVTKIVESLVNFSHAGSSNESIELGPCNLADCIDEAIHLLSLDRDARQVRYTNHCDRELVVLGDSQRLLQVFVNLIGNARDACDDEGHIQVQAYTRGEHILVDVDDNGSGIPAELQNQVFDPFFTTKDPGAGTGLGLALVYSIMDDLGGSVQLTSPLQEGPHPGTRFTLKLATSSYGSQFDM